MKIHFHLKTKKHGRNINPDFIRKNGMIGDYAWGVKMKRALLDVEV